MCLGIFFPSMKRKFALLSWIYHDSINPKTLHSPKCERLYKHFSKLGYFSSYSKYDSIEVLLSNKIFFKELTEVEKNATWLQKSKAGMLV